MSITSSLISTAELAYQRFLASIFASIRLPRPMDTLSLSVADFNRIHGIPSKKLLDPTNEAAKPFPVLLCMDLEAFEHDHTIVTEIGLAALDMNTLPQDSDSKQTLKAWYEQIKHLHLRITERRHFVNTQFVKGCPEMFNFGSSTFVNEANVGTILQRAFAAPSMLDNAARLDVPLSAANGEVILVGHALKSDLTLATTLQFEIPGDIRRIDTQRVPGTSKKVQPGLSKLLSALQIKYSHLHNAGNDAAYTLRALLATTANEVVAPGAIGQSLRLAMQKKREQRTATKSIDQRGTWQHTEEKVPRSAEKHRTV